MSEPEKPLLRIRDLIAGAAVILWLAMLTLDIADVVERDKLPDTVPTSAGLAAAVATLAYVALAMETRVRRGQEQILANQERILANQEQMRAQLDALEVAFDAGREVGRIETINGGRGPRTVRGG